MPPLIQRVRLESSAARREWKQLREEPKKYSRETRGAVTGAADDVGRSANRMGGAMKTAFAGMVAFIGARVIGALGRVSGRLFEIGTAVEETAAKFQTTFGPAADTVDQFLETTGRMAGLTQQKGREITATLGAMAQGFDMSKEASAEFSTEVVTLAGDMASFNNTSIEESLRAIQSGLIGEQEPLRRYGILLSAATVEQKALQMRAEGVTGELSEQEKVLARLALAYEMAGVAVGDLERTQDSTANSAKRLRAEAGQIVEDFSVGLIPAYGELISRGKELLQLFKAEADTLGGAFANAIIDATEFVVDMGIASGRTASSILAMLDALGFFSEEGGVGDAVLGKLGQIAENFMNLHVLGRGFIIILHETRAAIRELRADMAELVGDTEGAARQRGLGAEARALAEEQREILRQQRAADLNRKREREERRKQIAADIEAAKALREALGESDGPNAETLRKVDETLRKVSEAQQLMAAASDAERDALKDIFSLQEMITQIKKARADKDTEAARQMQEFAEKRLEVARRELSSAEELRKKIKEAADSFEGLVARGGRDPRIAQLMNRDPTRSLRIEDGFITPEALARVQESEAAMKRLEEAIEEAREKGISLNKALKESGVETENLSDALQGVATSIRAVTRFVDTFGDLSDEARMAADGISDVVDNVSRLSDASGPLLSLANLPSLIGAVAGAGSIIGSIIAASKADREEMRRLGEEISRNSRALRDFRQSVLEGGRVGSGISEEQAEQAEALLGRLIELSESEGEGLLGNLGPILGVLTGIDQLQIPGLPNMMETFSALQKRFGTQEGLRLLLEQTGLREILEALGQDLGEFTNDVAGAAERVRFMGRFLGIEAPEAARTFIQSILAIEGVTPKLRGALEELLLIDVTTEEGRDAFDKALRALSERFAEGGEAMEGWLGSLDPDEFQHILELLFGFTEEFGQKVEEVGDNMVDLAEAIREGSQNIRNAFAFAESLGLTPNQILDVVVDNFRKMFDTAGPSETTSLLNLIGGFDLSTEQGRQQLSDLIEKIMQAVLSGTTSQFGLTEEQAQQMIDALQGIQQTDQDAPGSRFTASLSNLRQISHAQGSELVFLAVERNFLLMDQIDLLGKVVSLLSPTAIQAPIFSRDLMASMESLTTTPQINLSAQTAQTNFNFGDMTINAPWTDKDEMIRVLSTEFERYLQERL